MLLKQNNLSVGGTSDFIEAHKNIIYSWFETMNVHVDNGRMVFENPSPELLDDYYRWLSNKARKQQVVVVNGQTIH